MNELGCRCRGFWIDCVCGDENDRAATQEDGLCDDCRCEHGCCEDHAGDYQIHQNCWNEKMKRLEANLRADT